MDELLKQGGQAIQGAENTVGNFFGGIGNAVAQIPQELHQFLTPPPQPQQQIPIQQPQQVAQIPLSIGQQQQSPSAQLTGNPAIDSALSKRDPEVDKINPQDVLSQYADYLNKAVGQLKTTIGQGVSNVGNFLTRDMTAGPQPTQGPTVGQMINKNIVQPISNSPLVQNPLVQNPITQQVGKIAKDFGVTSALNYSPYSLENQMDLAQGNGKALDNTMQQNQQIAAQASPQLFKNGQYQPLEGAQAMLKGAGLVLNPGSVAAMGAFNVPFTGVMDLLQEKNPLKMDVPQAVAQGIDFGALLGPLSDATGVLLKPLISKINPVEIGNINQYINMAKNATTPEMRNQIIQLTAKRIFQNLNAAGIQGAVGFGAYGGLQPAKDLEQRIGNVLGNALQGYAFGAGGRAVGLGFQGIKEQAPAINAQLGQEGKVSTNLLTGGLAGEQPEAPVANAGLYDAGNTIYHGTRPDIAAKIEKAGFDTTKTADGSYWFTDNKGALENGNVQGVTGKGAIVARNLTKDMKFATPEQFDKLTTDQLLQQGYDGVKYPKDYSGKGVGTYYQVFNPEKLSRVAQPTIGDMLKPNEEYPNLTQRGQTLLSQLDESKSLPNSASLRSILEENGITAPDGRITNADKTSLLDQLRQKGTTYEVNPEGTKSALREPLITSTMAQEEPKPTNPSYFEREMEARPEAKVDVGTTSPTDMTGKREDLPLREALNRTTEPTGTSLSNIPPGGLRDDYAKVYKEMQSETPNDYGMGRQAEKIVKGREAAAKTFGARLEAQIAKDLPQASDRELLRNYLDGSLQEKDVPKNVMDVAKQVRPLTDLAYRLRQNADSHIQATKDYVPRVPTTEPKGMGGQRLPKPLSVVSRENFHRDIAKFTDEEGNAVIGTKESLGLTPTELKGIYTDAQGNEFTASKAKITEIEDAGVQQYEKDAGKLLGNYIANTMKVKERYGFIDALRRSGAYEGEVIPSGIRAPSNYREVNVRGLEGYLLSPKLANSVEHFARKFGNTPLALRVYDEVAGVIRNSIFYNFIVHPLNMYAQALIGSGRAEGPLGMIKLHMNLVDAAKSVMSKDDSYIEHLQNGADFGEFGKRLSKPGMFQRIAQAVLKDKDVAEKIGLADTLNPIRQLYRTNTKIVAWSDDVLRMGLYKTLEGSGMPIRDAIKTGDKFMVDYGNMSDFERNVVNRFLIFYPWAKGLFGAGKEMVTHPIQNAGTIANFALLYATFSAAQYGLQQATGNKDARLRFPGMLGMARDVTEAPGQVMNEKRLPTIIDSHIAPIPSEIAQQIANRDFFTNKQIYNPLALPYNGVNPPTEAQARLQHLTGLIAPIETLGKAAPTNNPNVAPKKSVQELLLNQVGISTPHLQGYQATPNMPNSPLNTPNAQPGTGLDMLKKIQGVTQNTDAQTLSAYQVLAQIRQLDPNDPKRGAAEYNLYSTFPKLFQYAQDKAYANANDDESKVDPIYLKSNAAVAQKYMTYEKLNDTAPGSAEEKQYLKNNPEVLQLIQARSAFYTANPIPQQQGSMAYMLPPQPSAAVQAQMDAKNYTDPATQAYLKAHLDYVNGQRAKQGLSPLDSYGNIQGSKNFGVVFGSSGSTGMPASVKRMIGREASYNRSQGKLKAKRMIASLGGKKKALSLGGGHVTVNLKPIKVSTTVPKRPSRVVTIGKSKPIATNYKKIKKQKVRLA